MFASDKDIITLLLIVCTYILWVMILAFMGDLPYLITFPLLTLVIAFHSSLQHEVLHGHPFKNSFLSAALVYPAIGIFVPFLRFKDTHLSHHLDSRLTDPYDDPESNYLCPMRWAKLNPIAKAILRFNNTLFGRILIGPAIGMASFIASDLRAIFAGDRRLLMGWALHVPAVLIVLFVVQGFDVSIWLYLLACYFALSILKIRTFLEHRAHEQSAGRSVVIEDRGLLAFLFLNNNLHAVHHAHPQLPWYQLPEKYKSNKESFLKRNRNYYYQNYWAIFRSYFLKRKDDVPHPFIKPEERN